MTAPTAVERAPDKAEFHGFLSPSSVMDRVNRRSKRLANEARFAMWLQAIWPTRSLRSSCVEISGRNPTLRLAGGWGAFYLSGKPFYQIDELEKVDEKMALQDTDLSVPLPRHRSVYRESCCPERRHQLHLTGSTVNSRKVGYETLGTPTLIMFLNGKDRPQNPSQRPIVSIKRRSPNLFICVFLQQITR
jgi:hypothetical protein